MASVPPPRPYDLGLSANPELTWEGIGIEMPSPCDIGLTSNPDLRWEDIEAQPGPEAASPDITGEPRVCDERERAAAIRDACLTDAEAGPEAWAEAEIDAFGRF